MRYILFTVAFLCLTPKTPAAPDPLAPLLIYSGAWTVTHKDSPNADKLVNQCTKTAHFVTCDQSVNGGAGALLVFIPRVDKPGLYYTQNIRPEGRATSRGDLQIDGNSWTFLSNWDGAGHTTYYRTVNTFSGRTHIHYEQSESSNNKDWKVTNSGEETRTLGQGRK